MSIKRTMKAVVRINPFTSLVDKEYYSLRATRENRGCRESIKRCCEIGGARLYHWIFMWADNYEKGMEYGYFKTYYEYYLTDQENQPRAKIRRSC